jgi:hypothetical protein
METEIAEVYIPWWDPDTTRVLQRKTLRAAQRAAGHLDTDLAAAQQAMALGEEHAVIRALQAVVLLEERSDIVTPVLQWARAEKHHHVCAFLSLIAGRVFPQSV